MTPRQRVLNYLRIHRDDGIHYHKARDVALALALKHRTAAHHIGDLSRSSRKETDLTITKAFGRHGSNGVTWEVR